MQQMLDQATSALMQGNASVAEKALRQVLAEHPINEEALALLGHCLSQQNKLSEAVEAFEQVVLHHPLSANAHAELASTYQAIGESDKAITSFERSVELAPENSDAWHFLGNLLMKSGDIAQAKHCFQQSEKFDPFSSSFSRVQHALTHKNYHEAEKTCREVLQQHPNHPRALYTLATFANQVEAYEQAVDILERALKYSPFHVSLWQAMVKNLALLGMMNQSINAARQLVACDPNKPEYHITLAVELANAGKFEESLTSYDNAISIDENNANAYLLRGHVLKTLGRRNDCELSYQKSIELEKHNGTAYWALADLKSYQFNETDLLAMEQLFNNASSAPAQAAQAGFALAKSYEDKGEYDTAFGYYAKANQLRPDKSFDPTSYKANCDSVKAGFTQSVLATQAPVNTNEATPIFIVGLTRSGSTLLEQILASHSAIEGTMELYSLPRTVRRVEQLSKQKGRSYPEVMAKFTPEELAALGQSYLDETRVFRTGKPYFIDKLPPNFHNVGLIHMILPNAIVIDARRHPLSTGFSNFKQHFARGYDFSYDLSHIGHYYNCYLDLMDHWGAILPEKVLCVQYENMVQDTENQIKCLLAHCGLAFEEQCLAFHTNKRAVRTASSEQVRQPIYSRGMEQWKHFEQYLNPLKEALGKSTLERFNKFQ